MYSTASTKKIRSHKAQVDKLSKSRKGKHQPTMEDCLEKRDYTGALVIIEFRLKTEDFEDDAKQNELRLWLAYCAFHLGQYQKALDVYDRVTDDSDAIKLNQACCYYYLHMYQEAIDVVHQTQRPSALQNRLLFHCSHKLNDEDKLLVYHQKLSDEKVDQLSLAAIHYLRNHYQEATDIFKRLLLESRDDLALNVYVAMCYYRLDYYDVSLEIMQAYLQSYPTSPLAINVKACNQFKLYNGAAAKDEYRVLTDKGYDIMDHVLLKHNTVVFDDGKGALQLLPSLLDIVPEARLNLVIYYLRHDQVEHAHELIQAIEPSTPSEYILKAVVHATLGQSTNSRQHLKTAQQYFQLVGASATECDTIPGRQCMASCFFLLRQFEDVNIYINSIKQYLYNDDDFNWNSGLALASCGRYAEAQEALVLVQNETYLRDYVYISWLTRCYLRTKNGAAAWDMYLKLENSDESFNLLQLLAHDGYRMGEFYVAAKAFDVLERLDPDPEYWEGKRGACVGLFQQMIAGEVESSKFTEIFAMISSISNPQVEYIGRIIKKWCTENHIPLQAAA